MSLSCGIISAIRSPSSRSSLIVIKVPGLHRLQP